MTSYFKKGSTSPLSRGRVSTHTLQKPEGVEAFQACWLQVQGSSEALLASCSGQANPEETDLIGTSPPFAAPAACPGPRSPAHGGPPCPGDPTARSTGALLHQDTSEEFPISSVAHPDTCLAEPQTLPCVHESRSPTTTRPLQPCPMSHWNPPVLGPPHYHRVPTQGGHSATTPAELESTASHSPQVQADPGSRCCVLGLCLEETWPGNVIRTEIPTALLCLSQLSPEAHTSSLRKSS